MTLVQTIRKDLIEARKARSDRERIMLLSTLAGEVEKVGKDAGNRETTDAEAVAVVRKFIKNAEQSKRDMAAAGRDAGGIHREIGMLEAYLPASVPDAQVEADIREVVSSIEASGAKPNMGGVIKALKERYGDSFDGGQMSPIVKRILEG